MSIRREAKNWYDGALVDLEEAKSALSNGRFNWALFAAHQAVEKALKAAIIVLKRRSPLKTHDLSRLLSESNVKVNDEVRVGISELTPYYTIARYPNAGLERPWESIEKSTAERLVNIADKVVRNVGKVLSFEKTRATRKCT